MSGASSTTGAVDSVFYLIIGVSVFFLVLITFLMIYFIIKYNRKRNVKPKDIHGNTALEIIWTVIPTIIVLVLFYFGWKGFEFLRNAPEDSLTINVTARMWSWSFTYQSGLETDVLRVPAGKPVKLLLSSQDVIHSFYIPAFRIKEDAVPEFETSLWFEAGETGTYDILCAEYCGVRHSYMLSKVEVIPQDEYDTWYADRSKDIEEGSLAAADTSETPKVAGTLAGERLIRIKGCVACHSTDGSRMVGPSFKGVFGRKVEVEIDGTEQTVVADEKYLRNSILQPNDELVKGFQPVMPSQKDLLTEAEITAIIQYLKEN